jgi:hypothetical protein
MTAVSDTRAIVRLEKSGVLKESDNLTGNRTCNPRAYIVLSQSITLPYILSCNRCLLSMLEIKANFTVTCHKICTQYLTIITVDARSEVFTAVTMKTAVF